jgi:streptogramin lyase
VGENIATSRSRHGLNLAVLVVAAALVLSAFGLPPVVGGSPVAAAASCTKFFESNIDGWAIHFAFGPQNRLWLTESFSPAELRGVSPAGGPDVSYTLGAAGSPNRIADPQGITVGADGRLWITGLADQKVGAVDPATGALASWSLPGGPARIAAGADGDLWVTLNTANAIAKVDTTGTVLATYPAGIGPWDITPATDGALWFTELGASKIGRLTTAGVLTEYAIGAPARDLTANGADVWFTEQGASKIGHLTLVGASFPDIATPTPNSAPTGIAVGSDGGVWFTEHDVSRIGRLAPGLGTINETIITTSSQPPAPIIALPATVDGTIWFGIQAPHLEHFKPNPDGTVGPLPPAIALTAGTPVQITPGGPVYSTATAFTIGPSSSNPCIDSVSYRFYLAGTTPPGFTTVTGSTATFTLPSSGTWTVQFFATGPGGTSVVQTITLVVDQSLFAGDTTPPVLTVPANISVPATSVSGAVVTYTATAVDAKDGPVTPKCDPPSGSLFPIGVTTVTCTAADKTGNTSTQSFTVTVIAGPPVVTGPGNLVLAAASGTTTPVTFTVSAVSPWGGSLPVTCTPPGTTLMSPGTFVASFANNVSTTVTCVSATDAFGHSGSVSFTVTPVTPPVLSLPANMTVTATGPTTPVTFTATATGPGGAAVPLTCTPPSGSGFALGTTVVTCVANDRGVTTTGSFTVTVTNIVAKPSTLTITSAPSLPQGATTVSAKLLGPGGTPIVGRTVKFTAGTATGTGVTNASGVAAATLTLAPGTYVLTATFAGDASYTASTATAPLVVTKKDDDGKDKGGNNNNDGKDKGGNNNGGGNNGNNGGNKGGDGRGGRD